VTSWGLWVLETCLNHVFQELTPNGVPVWQWDAASHIPVTETTAAWRAQETSEVRTSYDPWHFNSIEPTGDGYILGFRHLDAIYKVENTVVGNIVWKLGGTPHPESLQIVNDPFNGISGQHDARLLPDGSVTLYDNGTLGLGPPRPPPATSATPSTSRRTRPR
jgi:Arylsulfotransferase (ASST)